MEGTDNKPLMKDAEMEHHGPFLLLTDAPSHNSQEKAYCFHVSAKAFWPEATLTWSWYVPDMFWYVSPWYGGDSLDLPKHRNKA